MYVNVILNYLLAFVQNRWLRHRPPPLRLRLSPCGRRRRTVAMYELLRAPHLYISYICLSMTECFILMEFSLWRALDRLWYFMGYYCSPTTTSTGHYDPGVILRDLNNNYAFFRSDNSYIQFSLPGFSTRPLFASLEREVSCAEASITGSIFILYSNGGRKLVFLLYESLSI